MSETRKVRGRCPKGCGETLFLGNGGYVTCSWLRCPAPDAAHMLLERAEKAKVMVSGDDIDWGPTGPPVFFDPDGPDPQGSGLPADSLASGEAPNPERQGS